MAHGAKREGVISDNAIVKAVQVEFDRTLPFWRCYQDLRLATDTCNNRPAVVNRETKLVVRVPCKVFTGVDVVWARTTVTLRTPLQQPPGKTNKRYRYDDPAVRLTRYWLDVPYRECTHTLGTMHFVHHDAHKRGSSGQEKSFHIQSVVFYDDPSHLQCVAGTMVTFAFSVYTSLRVLSARRTRGLRFHPLVASTDGEAPDKEEALHQRLRGDFVPNANSRVLVLGMGGNSMALCLRAVLGPGADIHVVEMEPAVIEVCRWAETLPKDSQTDVHLHVHVREASDFLTDTDPSRGVADNFFDMVFMDLFEPVKAAMDKSDALLRQSLSKVKPGGLLVINDHQLPDRHTLRPFTDLVGADNVQAVNLHGWKESVVVCVKPGHPDHDNGAARCQRIIFGITFDVYEELLPGWLPHPSWLKDCKQPPGSCLVWRS